MRTKIKSNLQPSIKEKKVSLRGSLAQNPGTSSYMFSKLQMPMLRRLSPEMGEKQIYFVSGETHLKLELENWEVWTIFWSLCSLYYGDDPLVVKTKGRNWTLDGSCRKKQKQGPNLKWRLTRLFKQPLPSIFFLMLSDRYHRACLDFNFGWSEYFFKKKLSVPKRSMEAVHISEGVSNKVAVLCSLTAERRDWVGQTNTGIYLPNIRTRPVAMLRGKKKMFARHRYHNSHLGGWVSHLIDLFLCNCKKKKKFA